jgi:hypothetical protein
LKRDWLQQKANALPLTTFVAEWRKSASVLAVALAFELSSFATGGGSAFVVALSSLPP